MARVSSSFVTTFVVLLWTGLAPAAPPLPRQNVRVNDPALDDSGHANQESSIAVSGGRIVIGFNDASSDRSGYAFSTDGGATFTHRRIPAPPAGGLTLGHPTVAFGPAGEVYYGTRTLIGGGQVSSLAVAKSTDSGATFSPLVDAAGITADGFSIEDEVRIAVDANAGSHFSGNLYVVWTDFDSSGAILIVFSRSTDGGGSFSVPVPLSLFDNVGVRSPTVAVAPNGDLYIAFEDGHVSPAGITVLKSTNGGVSFQGKTLGPLNPLSSLTGGGGGVSATSAPSLAVDGSGRVHIVFAAASSGTQVDRSDIFYLRSTDSGTTWGTARKLNDDGTTTTQAFPAVAVTADGAIGVTWKDRRNDPTNDALTDVYLAVSSDGGVTFGKSIRVTDTNWPYGPADPVLGAGVHGAYDGIAASGGNFYLSWGDERGTDSDVYFAYVPASFDASTPDFNISTQKTWAALKAGRSVSIDLATSGVNGFSGDLSLSVAPEVPGLSASFSSATVAAGQTARLTITTSSSAAPRDVRLTVTATGGGANRATAFWLTVYDPSRPVDPPVDVTQTPGQTAGTVKADAAGRLHLVYEDDSGNVRGSDVFYRRSTDGGATFSAPVKLNASNTIAFDPVVAADAAGRVVAVFSARAPGDSKDRAWVARSTDGGATFASALAVSPSDQSSLFPTVALDASGNVLVAYYDVVQGFAVLGTTRATIGGAFDAPVAVAETPQTVAPLTRPGLAFDSKGAAYIVYTRQVVSGLTVFSAVRLAVARNGRSFGTPVSLTDATSVSAFSPDVAVGPDDSVAVTYYDRLGTASGDVNREVVLTRSTDSGATFSSPVTVSNNTGQSYVPTVVVEPSGAIGVAWEDDAGNAATDVFYSRSTDGGRTFSAPFNVSADLGFSGSAANPFEGRGGTGRVALSVGSGGTLHVSWLDDSAANPDVFLLSASPADLVNNPPTATITSPAPMSTVEAGVPVTFTATGSDPDGDPITFAWSFGDGTSAAGAAPPPHPFAQPGTYVVTVTVRDGRGGSATASVTVTVASSTISGTSLLLPVVLDTPGLGGSHYSSEVTLTSRSPSSTEVLLTYVASQGGGNGVARLALAPGEQRVIPGVIAYLRSQNLAIPDDGSPKIGTLLATFGGVSSASTAFAGARTFTPDPSGGPGTFGLFYASAGTTTSQATLFGLQQSGAQRSNVAFVNAGSDPITLRVALQGPHGEDLGLLPDQNLGPFGWAQVNQPLAGKTSSGRAIVTRIAGTSAFTVYAVLNDAVTSDGSFIPPVLGDDGSGADRLVPVVLDAQGIGARFRTELTLANFTGASLPLTLAYRAAANFGSGSGSVALTLDPHEQRIISDVISFLRGSLPIESDGRSVGGSLLVRAPGGTAASALAVGARTFVPISPAGSFGLFYPGLTLGESATTSATVYGLQQNASQRSNLAIVSRGDAGDAITLRITYFSGSGAALGTPVEHSLEPGEWFQFGRPLENLGAPEGYARIERISGLSRWAAYGVLNDNVSSDGSYIAMSP